MRAVAITPRQPGTARLVELPEPVAADWPGGRGVAVELLEVGVDGTDRELLEGSFGLAPDGCDFLVLGHESLGRVIAVGPEVTELAPGDLVTATVRRPGNSVYDLLGEQDMTTDAVVYERGIVRLHGFLSERYVDAAEHLVPVPAALRGVGVLAEPMSVVAKGLRQAETIQRRLPVWELRRAAVMGAGPLGLLAALALRLRGLEVTVCARSEAPNRRSRLLEQLGASYRSLRQTDLDAVGREQGPFDLIFEATGHPPMIFEAFGHLARNGVEVLASGSGHLATAEVPIGRISGLFVGGNRVMVGTVNAHRRDFVTGLADFAQAETLYPGWLGALISHRVRGLDAYTELFRLLCHEPDCTKAVMTVGGEA